MAKVADLLLLTLEEEEEEDDHLHPETLGSSSSSEFWSSDLRRDFDLAGSDRDFDRRSSPDQVSLPFDFSYECHSNGGQEDELELDVDLLLLSDRPPNFRAEELGLGSGLDDEGRLEEEEAASVSDWWGADEIFAGGRWSSVDRSIDFPPVDEEQEGLRIAGFDDSDSDSDEQGIVAIDAQGHGVTLEDDDDDLGLPLCWDCLRGPDDNHRRDLIEEFEWEEVDARLEEREEVLTSIMVDADDGGTLSDPELEHEDADDVARSIEWDVEDAVRSIEWEVLLAMNNLGRNPMGPEDADSFVVDDHEGFVYTSEYEVLFGQFPDHGSSLKGGPPAARSVAEGLPSVVLTKEEIANGGVVCAVCKDDVSAEEEVKRLPCSHHYHGECILPWLSIRNTCPVCRFELPTDDPEYEKWKAQRASGRAAGDELRARYDFDIFAEA